MDPDVRAKGPGKCSRCGMDLEPGIPDIREYRVKVSAMPPVVRPGQKTEFRFEVLEPEKGERVRKFQVVHEKLLHLFAVSQDLEYFAHEHPTLGPDGIFRWKATLPKPGAYRLVFDFYPTGGTPQMIPRTWMAGKAEAYPAAKPERDLSPKHSKNLEVDLATEPAEPIAGKKTLLFFHLKPADGLEPYIGAWGHLLAVSDDLIDTIHTHPFIADGGPQVQFNIIFPREAVYRIWVQFQRRGKVNTAAFTVPVSRLR